MLFIYSIVLSVNKKYACDINVEYMRKIATHSLIFSLNFALIIKTIYD